MEAASPWPARLLASAGLTLALAGTSLVAYSLPKPEPVRAAGIGLALVGTGALCGVNALLLQGRLRRAPVGGFAGARRSRLSGDRPPSRTRALVLMVVLSLICLSSFGSALVFLRPPAGTSGPEAGPPTFPAEPAPPLPVYWRNGTITSISAPDLQQNRTTIAGDMGFRAPAGASGVSFNLTWEPGAGDQPQRLRLLLDVWRPHSYHYVAGAAGPPGVSASYESPEVSQALFRMRLYPLDTAAFAEVPFQVRIAFDR